MTSTLQVSTDYTPKTIPETLAVSSIVVIATLLTCYLVRFVVELRK